MDFSSVRTLIAGTVLVDVEACRRELGQVRGVRGLLDAREVEVLARLDELTVEAPAIFPEDELAKAAKSSLTKAVKVRNRKDTCSRVPELAAALAEGATTGDRVDVLANATVGLNPDELARVAAHGPVIAEMAANGTPRQYRETVERIVGQARDDDGLDRLARQRRATRLRWWTDPHGMWNLSGKFDPVRGMELEGRLRNTVEALFHDTTPDDAPADPLERQDFLAAEALLAICEGNATGSGVADVTVLIDERTFLDGHRHDDSVVDAGLGRFGLPIETVRRWACIGSVTPVVVGADGVRLYLGRETRLANRAQRRALRAMYRTCALCDVPFEHTQIHHVTTYALEHGLTDIDNLVPLCRRHHHLAHEGAWKLHLAADRTLTITKPDGTTNRAPPRAHAA
ncbi:MAG TPA: DUF222 domain-containing protein [Ilumatobacteraceae bacterium]